MDISGQHLVAVGEDAESEDEEEKDVKLFKYIWKAFCPWKQGPTEESKTCC